MGETVNQEEGFLHRTYLAITNPKRFLKTVALRPDYMGVLYIIAYITLIALLEYLRISKFIGVIAEALGEELSIVRSMILSRNISLIVIFYLSITLFTYTILSLITVGILRISVKVKEDLWEIFKVLSYYTIYSIVAMVVATIIAATIPPLRGVHVSPGLGRFLITIAQKYVSSGAIQSKIKVIRALTFTSTMTPIMLLPVAMRTRYRVTGRVIITVTLICFIITFIIFKAISLASARI